jgi:hypothetical protein
MNKKTNNGAAQRAAVLTLLAERHDVYVLRGRRALLEAAMDRGWGTADDVRQSVALPPGVNPKCFGAVAAPLVAAGILSHDGFTQTLRREAHARPISRWRLLDAGRAAAWLAANPDEPDAAPAARQLELLND